MLMDFLKLLKPKVHLSRNGYDLSRKHVFSTKIGQLRPCLSVETVPNDHFEIDIASLVRTNKMNTAAFLRGKQRYDFFFVPYSQLWHPFNQFVTQRTDKHSTNQKGHLNCPVLSLGDLLFGIWYTYFKDHTPGEGEEPVAWLVLQNDIMGFNAGYEILDNLDLLGYGNFRWLTKGIWDDTSLRAALEPYYDKYVNIFRLAAFQHIWYDYYRNKYYDLDANDETGGIASIDYFSRVNVDMFNFDDVDCSSFANSQIQVLATSDSSHLNPRIVRLLQPRYVQWKKDLYTSLLPGQQFGAVSTVDMLNPVRFAGALTSRNVDVSSTSSETVSVARGFKLQPGSSNDENLVIYGATGVLNANVSSSFDVLALRKAEMLQVWKQRTLRAGNMTDDQWNAHFGTTPYYDADENVHYLGSFSAPLQVNDVVSTAQTGQTENGQLADIGAYGTSLIKGNKLRFDARDFGVIMCVSSFLPESEYQSSMIDKANTLFEQFDFFTPEFENIGLEAVERPFYDNNAAWPLSNQVMGYAPRYWMYKTAVDKVFGEFSDSHLINTNLDLDLTVEGTLKAWVAPRFVEFAKNSSTGAFAVFNRNFYVNPQILDNVLGIAADYKSDTDQLLHNVYFDIKAIRPMSELGLPQF